MNLRRIAGALWIILAAAHSLAACGGPPQPELHQGFFGYGFETSSFRPCNANEAWWVQGEGDIMQGLLAQYDAVAPQPYGEVYVELRGTLSEPGTYGHLGAYTREFTVTEVVSVGGEPDGGCS